ncbi:tail fiber protein [Azospirillum sp.]|uniref:phage tail protein n=1 Tax=Azospirillum sp. TaxID=34012 RepID=UPI00262EF256|nr:tail fiber protein [Azospirillum sp.]
MDGYIGEIRFFAFNYTPQYWMPCDGRRLTINQFQALYSILGHRFDTGTASTTTFCVPNLSGRVAMGYGSGPGLTTRPTIGAVVGSNAVTLTPTQLPIHNHNFQISYPDNLPSPSTALPSAGATLNAPFANDTSGNGVIANAFSQTANTTLAPQSLTSAGSSASHENRSPVLAFTASICLEGEYPVNPG